MTWMEWYNNLAKPSWTPAPSTISLIWMILYPIIVVSFGFVFLMAFRGKVRRSLAVPFAINVVADAISPSAWERIVSEAPVIYIATVASSIMFTAVIAPIRNTVLVAWLVSVQLF